MSSFREETTAAPSMRQQDHNLSIFIAILVLNRNIPGTDFMLLL